MLINECLILGTVLENHIKVGLITDVFRDAKNIRP